MKPIRQTVTILIAAVLLLCTACSMQPQQTPTDTEKTEGTDIRTVELNTDTASLDGEPVEVFDYTWHCDPSVSHNEDENAPAEYHTGTMPQTEAAVYIDRDLPYFPQLPEDGFRLVNYDGEQEWAYYYTDGEHEDFIFATLPKLGNALPSQMMHAESEAADQQVLHITQPGTYRLKGTWKGQILIDLGDEDETAADDKAKVTLIFDGADISCSVAPAVICRSAFECDNAGSDYPVEFTTDNAGMTVILADGSENTVTGTNVFRMLKTKYKDDEAADEIKVQKKLRKTDGAFYSYVTMQINAESQGTGKLTVNAGFEGIDSEMHLAFNGGNITVNSQDDGINVNEDNVSIVSFNGGMLTINAALGAEGDGVDSNGFIELNGATLNINGIRVPDSALDSECGITYQAGTVVIDGEEQSYTPGEVFQESGMNGASGQPQQGGMQPPDAQRGQNFDLEAFKQAVAGLPEDATFEDVLALLGMDMMPQGGQPGEGQPQMPNGEQPEEQPPEGGMPDVQQPPEKP